MKVIIESEYGSEFALRDDAGKEPNAVRTWPDNEFKDNATEVPLQGAPEVDGKRSSFP